ncbi:MAG: hypothetical protein ACK5LR_07255 [Mangrovibacterium sp.]
MNNEESLILKIRQNFLALQRKCDQLKEESKQQALEIEELKSQILDASYEKQRLERDYENLKVAGILSMHDEDKELTKKRINQMVREIDKCIAQLNV